LRNVFAALLDGAGATSSANFNGALTASRTMKRRSSSRLNACTSTVSPGAWRDSSVSRFALVTRTPSIATSTSCADKPADWAPEPSNT